MEIKGNSQVVVRHMKGEYEARGEKMKKYLEKVKELIGSFNKISFTKIPREENSTANALACISLAAEEGMATSNRPVQELAISSIIRVEQVAYMEQE